MTQYEVDRLYRAWCKLAGSDMFAHDQNTSPQIEAAWQVFCAADDKLAAKMHRHVESYEDRLDDLGESPDR